MYEGLPYMGINTPEALQNVKDFRFREDDVLLVTYPKAGTTWICQIANLLIPQGDYDNIRQAAPILEFTMPDPDSKESEDGNEPKRVPCTDIVGKRKSPRVFSTHLYPSFFNEPLKHGNPRVIVLMRNPKDCLVSYYHFYRVTVPLGQFKGTFDEFYDMHRAKHIVFGDVIDHFKLWWEYKNDPRFLFLWYEDMKLDLEDSIRTIVKFLQLDTTEEEIGEITEKSTFDSMSKNPKTNFEKGMDTKISKYMRKGCIGDWVNTMTDEQSYEIDERYKKELAPLGLTFKFS